MGDLLNTFGPGSPSGGVGTPPIAKPSPPIIADPGTITETGAFGGRDYTLPDGRIIVGGGRPGVTGMILDGILGPKGFQVGGSTDPYAPTTNSPSSGGGGFLDTVNKIASNPLLLAGLKGYGTALAMPTGKGPITRAVGGLATGLHDYYVDEPYQRAATEQMTQQGKIASQKAQREQSKFQRKEDARKGLSPEQQQALDLGEPYSQIATEGKEAAANKNLNEARAAQWDLAAQEAKTPAQAQMYHQMGESLRAAGGHKVDDGALKAASEAASKNQKDAFDQAHMKFEEGIAKQNVNLRGAEFGLGQKRFGFEEQKYREEQPLRDAELAQRQMSTRATQAGIPKTQAESDFSAQEWERFQRLPEAEQQRVMDIKWGLQSKPKEPGTEKTAKIEFPDPVNGQNVTMRVPESQVLGMQQPMKYSEKEKAGIQIVKSTHELGDALRKALSGTPDERSIATRYIQYWAYRAGVQDAFMGQDRAHIISLVAGAYQKLASEAATTAGLRNFGFIERVTPHFPDGRLSDQDNLQRLDVLDGILDEDAAALRTPGIIKDPERKRRAEEQIYSQFGSFYKAIQGGASQSVPTGAPGQEAPAAASGQPAAGSAPTGLTPEQLQQFEKTYPQLRQ